MTMLTLKKLYEDITLMFKDADLETPDLDARRIIEERSEYGWSDIITRPDAPITQEQHDLITSDIKARLSGKPISRIYGCREFWGLDFEISEDTLDPRPDTELIIELALKSFSKGAPLRILDLGTGSGCILISLLHEFPNAQGIGTDLSAGALKLAKINAKNNGCASRAEFKNSNWLDSISDKFDLIVSNPPYIKNQIIPTLSKEVQNHDPILALDGGVDGLNPYKIIFPQLKTFLNEGGKALFEIGYDQANDVMRLAEESRFMLRTVHDDLAGNPRVVDISCGDK